ncbi:CoB--CoM heterodisulfide reductase iron-sulfur subunit B family protein [Candidatus Eisenbacteria bacterium]|uniref:CoB--CoM heterodisulfide reductase iron-sulfur subunit B family protein n=1 Tax=Eiseniibacteriota bacterium TaxID=2212470 RepID=A0ABV6YIC6_UNCEI
MKAVFFPGCLIPIKYPHMEASVRRTLPALGIEIIDLDGLTCCPDPIFFQASDKIGWLTVAARNLCQAEEAGLDFFTICSGCTGTLSEANHLLKEDEALRERINKRLARIGKEYRGTSEVRHIVAMIREKVGVDRVRESVKRPLTGVRVALHYGCHLLKPADIMRVDDPDDPQILHQLIEAIGAEPVPHDERFLCCGKACVDPNLPLEMTGSVLKSIKKTDIDCMGLICPTCFSSFDTGQLLIARKTGEKLDVPPVYYFQLLALAQGLAPEDVGLNRHRVKPLSLFEKIGVSI